jgi:hypothetical protein
MMLIRQLCSATLSSENRERTDVEEEPIGFSRNDENEIKGDLHFINFI